MDGSNMATISLVQFFSLEGKHTGIFHQIFDKDAMNTNVQSHAQVGELICANMLVNHASLEQVLIT